MLAQSLNELLPLGALVFQKEFATNLTEPYGDKDSDDRHSRSAHNLDGRNPLLPKDKKD